MPELKFVAGPALTPVSELRSWLGSHRDTLIRIPMAIEMSGFDVGPAWIATTAADPAADAIHVTLDQGALGVGLVERLGALCQAPTRCVVWLQGYWKPTLSGGPDFAALELPGPKREPFSVRDVVGLVAAEDAARVQVAAVP